MLSPQAQERLRDKVGEFLEKADRAVTILVISLWSVPPKDIACSAVNLAYTRNEADVQIEVRHTVGLGIYRSTEVFDPTVEMQIALVKEINARVGGMLFEHQMICSAWTKPYSNSTFEVQSS
jgi:hypothetical protein